MTRREFLAAAAAAPAAAGAVHAAVSPKVQPFALTQVHLLDGPFLTCQEANRKFLHSLESDRLLHTFRLTAGLPSTAEPLGGWERPTVELRGHFMGHYLSGCALMSAATGDDELKSKAAGIVAELAKCQKANGGDYLSAYPPEFLDRLVTGKKVWAPWYTLHKIMAGLLDQYLLSGNTQALEVLEGMTRAAGKWAAPLSDEQMARIQLVEFGGMNDVLYGLYAATGRQPYLDLAHRFDHKAIFDPLAEGRDELINLHANTNVPKIIGAARRYEISGETRYRDIAGYFWREVTSKRSYCTGGTSDKEHWRRPSGHLAGTLSNQNQECCVTYNMLKLTRHLFTWHPEAQYADYYERAFFNSILGTMNPEDGMTMYFVPLAPGYWKLFCTPRNSFWCCTGTGAESFSKLADSIYFHNDRELYVNLFIASRLEWPEKGLALRQETNFPEREGTSLRFEVKQPVEVALRLRVPYWATRGITVKVNGKPQPNAAAGPTYITVARTWHTGDEVEIEMPMSLHTEAMPDDDSVRAFLYGPLVLAGDLGTAGLTREMQYGDDKGGHTCKDEPMPAPALTGAAKITRVGRSLEFRAEQQNLTLLPLNRILHQRYAVYWMAGGMNSLTEEEKSAGWKLLFDGRTFDGWENPALKSPPGDAWTIEEGCLKATAKPKMIEDLFTTETFTDFEMVWDWKLARGSNSGVKYRIQDRVMLVSGKFKRFEDSVQESILHRRQDRPVKGQEYVVGFEYQMIDNAVHADARRGPKYQAGALYDLVGPTQDVTRPIGEFNHSRLVVKGNHAEHWLNGVKVVDVDLAEAAKASDKRWGADSEVYRLLTTQPRGECQISLQNHNDPAWFRNIKLRRL
jgi:DUF1680 family protein